MSGPLVRYRAFSHKVSFAENLRNLALTQRWGSRSDEDIQEHVTATLTEPPRISMDYLVKEVEEEMDFADALISFTQPPLTKIDMLLEKELSGRPLSFRERDYTPAIAASPFYISHSYPSLWILCWLGVSKDDNFFENVRLEKGSPLRLFDLDLACCTFGFDAPSLFCTIDYFVCDEPGFMIVKADTHLYTRMSKHNVLIPPSFFIAIPKKFVHPGNHTYINKEGTFRHLYQKVSGRQVLQLPRRDWERNTDWLVSDKRSIKMWFEKGQRKMCRQWRNHWKAMSNEEKWSFEEEYKS
ncbi:hypothetical protein PILCRDRAFT_11335 [Piloderma croceum F 1598]|uniref:Uncharacterized protein n=1 Tax=Piloderma croceum (strain F 1598) TaxID=765440 RepID=A0A0C3BM10_PILCF|nr:hypothetical protein PILCRDRAFT_11335 [Piloderma croceum F 1598]